MESPGQGLGQWLYAMALFVAVCSFTYLAVVPYP